MCLLPLAVYFIPYGCCDFEREVVSSNESCLVHYYPLVIGMDDAFRVRVLTLVGLVSNIR